MKTLPPLFNFKQATFFLQHLFIYQNYSPNMHSNSISPLHLNLYHIMHLSGPPPPHPQEKTRYHALIGTIPAPTPPPTRIHAFIGTISPPPPPSLDITCIYQGYSPPPPFPSLLFTCIHRGYSPSLPHYVCLATSTFCLYSRQCSLLEIFQSLVKTQ